MRLLGAALVAAALCAEPALAQQPLADAHHDLTPVQLALVMRKPLSMLPAGAADSQQPTGPGQDVAATSVSSAPLPPAAASEPPRFLKVCGYALELTFYEHVMRLAAQEKTRVELKGPFWSDYIHSVKIPHKWDDGDSWETTYLGHAMSGSAFARIWLDQRERKATSKKEYFAGLGRAFLFTILFSEQWENGPLSEASIGNVGLHPGRIGWVDHVYTPIGGVLWTMAEDAIDKYVVTFVDKHVPLLTARAAARMILNPARMLANVGENRLPWTRPDRPISAGLTIDK